MNLKIDEKLDNYSPLNIVHLHCYEPESDALLLMLYNLQSCKMKGRDNLERCPTICLVCYSRHLHSFGPSGHTFSCHSKQNAEKR